MVSIIRDSAFRQLRQPKQLPPTTANYHQLRPTPANSLQPWPTLANSCQLWPTAVNYIQLFPIVSNFCQLFYWSTIDMGGVAGLYRKVIASMVRSKLELQAMVSRASLASKLLLPPTSSYLLLLFPIFYLVLSHPSSSYLLPPFTSSYPFLPCLISYFLIPFLLLTSTPLSCPLTPTSLGYSYSILRDVTNFFIILYFPSFAPTFGTSIRLYQDPSINAKAQFL